MLYSSRNLLSLFAIALALCFGSVPAEAKHNHTKKASRSEVVEYSPTRESIVIDADTGKILHEENANTIAHPASLTKMMTLYMLFEALKEKQITLDTTMVVSNRAARQNPTKLYLKPRTRISVEEAIDALIIKSANDVAVVVAEKLGGTVENFCIQMTNRAKIMGMTKTVFKNPNGLPDKQHISTAHDMGILARNLIYSFPEYYWYFSKKQFEFRGDTIKGHNHFLDNYEGADGLKTGFTVKSGFNLAASARKNENRLVVVVFGGPTAKTRDDQVGMLMDLGFDIIAREKDNKN